MSEKKEKKEVKSETKEYIALDGHKSVYEKMMVVAKPAGAEPPTPQPETKKEKQEKRQE